MYSINCRGKLIDLSRPKVMGILNISPDSFFDGGKYNSEESVISQVNKMIHEGATFIDVGAISSRPGATPVPEERELELLLPVIKLLMLEFPEIVISVDTTRASVARKAIQLGASLINDISAGSADVTMFDTIAELQVPYIMMHMQGRPENMQDAPTYNDIVSEILKYFSAKLETLRQKGVHDIISDVGFGFGKSLHHNYQLLKHLNLFQQLEIPTLVGLSRKSMLYKPLKIDPREALNSTTSANTIALYQGANILRVHDVKEAIEAIKIFELTYKTPNE